MQPIQGQILQKDTSIVTTAMNNRQSMVNNLIGLAPSLINTAMEIDERTRKQNDLLNQKRYAANQQRMAEIEQLEGTKVDYNQEYKQLQHENTRFEMYGQFGNQVDIFKGIELGLKDMMQGRTFGETAMAISGTPPEKALALGPVSAGNKTVATGDFLNGLQIPDEVKNNLEATKALNLFINNNKAGLSIALDGSPTNNSDPELAKQYLELKAKQDQAVTEAGIKYSQENGGTVMSMLDADEIKQEFGDYIDPVEAAVIRKRYLKHQDQGYVMQVLLDRGAANFNGTQQRMVAELAKGIEDQYAEAIKQGVPKDNPQLLEYRKALDAYKSGDPKGIDAFVATIDNLMKNPISYEAGSPFANKNDQTSYETDKANLDRLQQAIKTGGGSQAMQAYVDAKKAYDEKYPNGAMPTIQSPTQAASSAEIMQADKDNLVKLYEQSIIDKEAEPVYKEAKAAFDAKYSPEQQAMNESYLKSRQPVVIKSNNVVPNISLDSINKVTGAGLTKDGNAVVAENLGNTLISYAAYDKSKANYSPENLSKVMQMIVPVNRSKTGTANTGGFKWDKWSKINSSSSAADKADLANLLKNQLGWQGSEADLLKTWFNYRDGAAMTIGAYDKSNIDKIKAGEGKLLMPGSPSGKETVQQPGNNQKTFTFKAPKVNTNPVLGTEMSADPEEIKTASAILADPNSSQADKAHATLIMKGVKETVINQLAVNGNQEIHVPGFGKIKANAYMAKIKTSVPELQNYYELSNGYNVSPYDMLNQVQDDPRLKAKAEMFIKNFEAATKLGQAEVGMITDTMKANADLMDSQLKEKEWLARLSAAAVKGKGATPDEIAKLQTRLNGNTSNVDTLNASLTQARTILNNNIKERGDKDPSTIDAQRNVKALEDALNVAKAIMASTQVEYAAATGYKLPTNEEQTSTGSSGNQPSEAAKNYLKGKQ